MNYYIQQTIHINFLRIDGITNSSVLQIGSAGIIKPSAHLYNTGGFTEAAPSTQNISGSLLQSPSVPLHSSGR